MKLAEALIERKALKTKMEELKSRIYKNAQTQEGDEPVERPLELLSQLQEESSKFERSICYTNDVRRRRDWRETGVAPSKTIENI